MMNDATTMRVEGFAQGRLIAPVSFQLRSAGPQEGQYDPRPRYPDGTLVNGGFVTGSNRGRPKGTGTGLGIGHSAEAKAEMVRRYKNGEGLHPLAAAFSTTAQRVREIVIQAGVGIRQAGYCRKENEQRSDDVKLTKENVQEILQFRSQGESYAKIAERFGIGKTTVIYHIGKANRGLKPNPAPEKKSEKLTEPPHLVDLVADAAANPPDPAMDDPTPGAAANDARVIQVHDLTVTAPRTYTPPAIIFDALLADMVTERNVFAVAHTIKAMTDKMQAIAGVTASFRFNYELTAGVRS